MENWHWDDKNLSGYGELNFAFQRDENVFTLSKNISQNTDYQIVTSNNRVEDYEKLNYQLSVRISILYPGEPSSW
jgi:hypothetical protein